MLFINEVNAVNEKREICRFIEKLEGVFNTDFRIWTLKRCKAGLMVDFLRNNGIEYKKINNLFRIRTKDGKAIYLKIIASDDRLYLSNSFLRKLSYYRELSTKSYKYIYKDNLYKPLVYKYSKDGKILLNVYDFNSKKLLKEGETK